MACGCNEVPITLSVEGKIYKGLLSQVAGSGSHFMWHLTINKHYYGQLFITGDGEFRFCGNRHGEMFEPFVREMEDVLISHYSS